MRTRSPTQTFDTYVRADSVLLAPGEARSFAVSRRKAWLGVWLSESWLNRLCPVCAADPDRGTALLWRLPLMVGCVEHGCHLVNAPEVELALALGEQTRPTSVDEPVATLDRYTHEALTTGQVTLPGRTVHIGVWFRLLRALLHEVSLAASTVRPRARETLERVWRATGRPERAGLTVWRPYENLDGVGTEYAWNGRRSPVCAGHDLTLSQGCATNLGQRVWAFAAVVSRLWAR